MIYINFKIVISALLTLTLLKLKKIYVELACVKTPRTRSLRATVKLIIKNVSNIYLYNIHFVSDDALKNYFFLKIR